MLGYEKTSSCSFPYLSGTDPVQQPGPTFAEDSSPICSQVVALWHHPQIETWSLINQKTSEIRTTHNTRSCKIYAILKRKHVHRRIITRAMTTASGCFAIQPVAGSEATGEPMKLNGKGAKHRCNLYVHSHPRCNVVSGCF